MSVDRFYVRFNKFEHFIASDYRGRLLQKNHSFNPKSIFEANEFLTF